MANGIEFSPNEYMVFEADQVLTKDHLNQLFDYLDQQNRWTRNKLIGIGIVCGLDLVQQPDAIQITRGCGVTSQGYLITQDDAETYLYYLPYTGIDQPAHLPFTYPGNLPFYKPFNSSKSIFLMLTQDEYDALDTDTKKAAQTIASLKSTKLIDSYAVVLFLEANEVDLKNCDTFDCDNKGEKMTLTLRPLLVKKNDLPVLQKIKDANIRTASIKDLQTNIRTTTKVSTVKSSTSSLSKTTTIGGTKGTTSTGLISAGIRPLNLSVKAPQINLKRFNVPYTDLNTTDDVINAFVKLVDDETLDSVAGAFNFCYDQYKDLLGDDASGFPTLLNDLIAQKGAILKSYPVFIQYFYDYIDDLIKAYYEFRVKVSQLLSTCCPDENLFPLHVVLGAATATTKDFAKDAYRNYFIYSPLFLKQENEISESVFLFKRMQILATQFTTVLPGELKPFAIKILPGQYQQAYLSQRVIPYYYKINVPGNELYRYWSYYKTLRSNETFNLSYNANLYNTDDAVTDPLLYDIERENFFRVEGHIGVNYLTALSDILSQRQKYNLPFDVVAISADQLPLGSGTTDLPECNIVDLDTNYKLLVSEFTCKVHTPFCFITQMEYSSKARVITRDTNVFTTADQAKLKELQAQQTAAGQAGNKTLALALQTDIDALLLKQKGSSGLQSQAIGTPLSFTQFRQQAFDEPQQMDLTLLQDGYQRGDFLNTYCPPQPDTIGSAYLASIKNGVFTNPVKISTNDPDSIYYHELFDYVDAVESLMMVFIPFTLTTIDMDDFVAAYKIFADSIFDVSEAITELLDDSVKTKTQSALDADDLEMDLVKDQLAEAVYSCVDERLNTLLTEYAARLQAYQLQQSFYNYYKAHSGLEHKAGVPKGGTFVLVYHPATIIQTGDTSRGNIFTANTFTASTKESSLQASSFTKSSSSNVAKLFLAKALKITPDKTTRATTKATTPKADEKIKVEKNTVIGPDVAAEKPVAENIRASVESKNVIAPKAEAESVKAEAVGKPITEKVVAAKEDTPVVKPEATLEKNAAIDTSKTAIETQAKEVAVKRETDTVKTTAANTAAIEAAAKEAAAKEAAAKKVAEELAKREAAIGKTKTEETVIPSTKETGTRTSTTTGTKTSTTNVKTSTGKSLLDINTLNLLANFADATPEITEDSKNTLLSILTLANDRLNTSQYAVADNVVIADFYVPYLCCSDCAPVVYIFPPKETPPPEDAEFTLASKEYVFDDAHNYAFTAKPPVTDKNKAENPFSSPDILNPGGLNLLTDDQNILYLHPAMELTQTTTSVVSYKNIPISITIIKPDASFDIVETKDAAGAPALQPVPDDANADAYTWLVNGEEGIFEDTKSPAPISIEELKKKFGTSTFTIELTISYTRNDNISEDTKEQTFQGQVCIDFEPPVFKLGTNFGSEAGQKEGDVAFTTDEKIVVRVQGFKFQQEGGTFGFAFIDNDPGVFGSSQCLNINNVLMEFDYSESSIQPSLVTVDYIDQGGLENFSVNGSDIFAGEISELPAEMNGVKITVTKSENRNGTVTMVGPVKIFQIGGQEFAIDNVCAQ